MDFKINGYHEVNKFGSSAVAASSLAKKIIFKTKKTLKKKGRCVWAVSGGSTILHLYDALLDFQDELNEFGEKLLVMWVDERLVPHSHSESNFGTAFDYFWKNFKSIKLLPVPYFSDQEIARSKYDALLKSENINLDELDIVILGMGTDGHTASLFPHNPAIHEQNKKITAVNDVSVKNPRISMTFPFINSSDAIYLLFFGEEKAKIFKKAVNSNSLEDYPIVGVNSESLEIYTDYNLDSLCDNRNI